MRLEIRRRVRDEREAPRVRLGKSIVREALQVLADLRRDCRPSTPRSRPCAPRSFVEHRHEPPLLPHVPHRPAQLVGLGAAVAAELHRDRHRLLLEDRNALRALENRLEIGMRVRHRLLPAPPRGVRMHELRLDRPRPNQRDLHDDVVQPIGLRVQDRRDLRAALDLERADRLAALRSDRTSSRRRSAACTSPAASPVRASITSNAHAHHRQRAESEEVELRHADHVEIVLVELDDRAAHRRLLDGQVVAERRGREHEPADVRRAQPRQSSNAADRREQRPAARRPR